MNLVSGAKDVLLDATARTALWAVTQSLVSVCVRLATLETNVKRVSSHLWCNVVILNDIF